MEGSWRVPWQALMICLAGFLRCGTQWLLLTLAILKLTPPCSVHRCSRCTNFLVYKCLSESFHGTPKPNLGYIAGSDADGHIQTDNSAELFSPRTGAVSATRQLLRGLSISDQGGENCAQNVKSMHKCSELYLIQTCREPHTACQYHPQQP